MSVKKIKDITIEKINAGKDVFRQVLISSTEGPNFAMRRFIIKPGGHMPDHTNLVEHEQLVLNGRAEIAIGDETYQVKKNDVVFIPANVPHWYKTLGDEAFEFLCVVPNLPDVVELV